MRITRRILIFALIVVTILLAACGAPAATPASVSPGEPAEEPQATEASAPAETEPSPLAPTAVSPPEESTVQPAFPERRRLTLEFPARIRAGDSDVVRLTLEVDDLGNVTPTAEIDGNVVTGEVIEIPNLYETHHVVAEARFDIAGMEVRPPDLVSEPLTQGASVTFYWSVRPPEVGDYRGTLWLYLRFVDKSNGDESRKTVSAQIVDIEAVNLLGLSGALARTTGIVGSIVGTVLGFPFLEDIIKFLFKRRSQRFK